MKMKKVLIVHILSISLCTFVNNFYKMSWITYLYNRFFKEEEPDPMKYLVVGLGNMGAEYDDTRHNVGFDVVDRLAKDFEVSFKNDQLGDIAEFRFKSRTFVLLKPSTYMNLSGKAVRYWLQKKKIKVENLLVIVDDKNIAFGSVRLRGKGSHGGHNGLKDIERILGGNKYARLRVGIGSEFSKGRQVDFVLGNWSSEEADQLPKILKESGEAVKSFGAIGLARTMNQFNKKGG